MGGKPDKPSLGVLGRLGILPILAAVCTYLASMSDLRDSLRGALSWCSDWL